MSQHTVQAVIGKAITDTLFRQSMFADPAATLASYELTPEEMDGLRAIDFETMECCARVLDDRIARGAMVRQVSGGFARRPATGAMAAVKGEVTRDPNDTGASGIRPDAAA